MNSLYAFEPFAVAAPDVSTAENDDFVLFASAPPEEADSDTAEEGSMSREDAVECVRSIREKTSEVRKLLLKLHDGKGWRALGYTTWEDCLQREFAESRRTLFRTTLAARVEQETFPDRPSGYYPQQLLLALAQLPLDQRIPALEYAQKTAPVNPHVLRTRGIEQRRLTSAHVARTVNAFLRRANDSDPLEVTRSDASVTEKCQVGTFADTGKPSPPVAEASGEFAATGMRILSTRYDQGAGRLLVVVRHGCTIQMIGVSLDELRKAGLSAGDFDRLSSSS